MVVSVEGLISVWYCWGALLEDCRRHRAVARPQAGRQADMLVEECRKARLAQAYQELRVLLEEGMDTQLEGVGMGRPRVGRRCQ